MILKHYTEVPAEEATEGPGIGIRWLISRPEGAGELCHAAVRASAGRFQSIPSPSP